MDQMNLMKSLFITANKAKRYLDSKQQTHGLAVGQSRVLRFIYDQTLIGHTVNQSDIHQAFSIRPASISELLDNLSNQGYVLQVDDVIDRRKKSVTLTETGKQKAIKAIELTTEFEAEIKNLFTENQYKKIFQALKSISKHIDFKETL